MKEEKPTLLTPVSQESENEEAGAIGCAVYTTENGVLTKHYVDAWHADVSVHKEPGVRLLLDKFEIMKSEKKLECMRSWQRQESSNFGLKYEDPFLCGIGLDIVTSLINVYWQFINPIDSVIESAEFWAEFDKYSKSETSGREYLLFATRVWIMLAYACRAMGDEDSLVQKIRQDLKAGLLVFSVDSSIQTTLKFVEDPWEFFLHCAETCITASNLFTTLCDLNALETFVLYISYLHDGSERNWIAWTYLGMANHGAQRVGLLRDPDEFSELDGENFRRRKLLFTMVTMNSLYSVDLGQSNFAIPDSMVKVKEKTDEFIRHIHEGDYIIAKYRLARLMNKSVECVRALYDGKINSDQLVPMLDKLMCMERQIDEVWEKIPLYLRLREAPSGGLAGRIRLDITLHLEEPAPSPKLVFQRYILDTLIQKIRHMFYRPFLTIELTKDSPTQHTVLQFREKFQLSAKALLENQFEIANKTDSELFMFRKFRWNYIFSPAFHASVLLLLQKKAATERDDWENQLLVSSVKLYKRIRSHVGCSAAKAHLILSALLEDNGETELESTMDTSPQSMQVRQHLPAMPVDLASLDDDFFSSVLGDSQKCEFR